MVDKSLHVEVDKLLETRSARDVSGKESTTPGSVRSVCALGDVVVDREQLDYADEQLAGGPFEIYSLERYGIPRELLEALVFEHGGDARLLELQQKGIKMGICDRERLLNRNGIISGPTCSGKTLLAELRMLARYFDEKRRVAAGGDPQERIGKTIFLVPMRAIGLERFGYFKDLYGQFGINVLYSDGDVRTHDGDILRGRFDVAILVNEKLKFFQRHNPEFIKNIGEVVVDEMGMMSDKSRGPYLEMVVTELLLSPSKPTILGLTTPLDGIERLVDLLDGFLLEVENRPIDIRAGVWTAGKAEFKSWSCNTLEAYPPERMDLSYPVGRERTLKELVLRYRRGIMFAVPTKRLACGYARCLCELVDQDPEVREAMLAQARCNLLEERLRGLETTRNREALVECFKRGLGFHHADLTPEERKEVELAFRNREIAVIFCTSTLARGVNLPAQTIIFIDWGDAFADAEQRWPYYVQLRDEFVNWMGRTGRLGRENLSEPLAIYLAQTASERIWVEKLIRRKKGRLRTHLADEDLDLRGHILLAASSLGNRGFAKDKCVQEESGSTVFSLRDIKDFFALTLTARDEASKEVALSRVIMGLVALVNPQGSEGFVQVMESIDKVLKLNGKGQSAYVYAGQRDLVRLILGMQKLASSIVNSRPEAMETMSQLEASLKDALKDVCRRKTLPELKRLFEGLPTSNYAGWSRQAISERDRCCLAKELGDLGSLSETDRRLRCVPGLKQIDDPIDDLIEGLIDHEFRNIRDKKGFVRLKAMKRCQLDREQLLKFKAMLEKEEVVQLFLQPSADGQAGDGNRPGYLRWVKADGKEGIGLTPFGNICCGHGVSTRTCDELYTWIATESKRELSLFDLFHRLLRTFDGRRIRLLRTHLPSAHIRTLLQEYAGQKSLSLPQVEDRQAAVTLLALREWITGVPTVDIEKRNGVHAGSLYEVSRQVSRLIRALADISKEMLAQSERGESEGRWWIENGAVRIPQDLEDLAEMVLYGLPSEAIPIARLHVDGLTRGWIMNLLCGVKEARISEDLPIVERLQLMGEEQLKEVLPTRGLVRRVMETVGEHGKSALARNLVDRRDFLVGYYMLPQVIKAQLDRSTSHRAEEARNTAIRVVTRDGRHTVLRRNEPGTGLPIKIVSEQDVIHWVKRGAVDFYGEICEIVDRHPTGNVGKWSEEIRHISDRFFVDLDPQNGYPRGKLKAVTAKLYDHFTELPQVKQAKIYWTGGKGFYVVGLFKDGIALNVQAAKQRLTSFILSWQICNDTDVFLKEDPMNLAPYLVLDLSTLMPRGLYRNELSIHAASGGCCIEVKFDHLEEFDPDLEATPESVKDKLISELTEEEKKRYLGCLSRESKNSIEGTSPTQRDAGENWKG